MADPESGVSASVEQTDPAASLSWETLEAGAPKETTETPPVETKEDESTQPVKPPVDEDHPTKLGRKVKDLGERFDSFMTKFDQYLESQNKAKPPEPKPAEEVADRYTGDVYEQMCAVEPPPVEYVTTPREQVMVRQWEQRVTARLEQSQRSGYESAYLNQAKRMADDGGDLHAQIMHMITADKSPYNAYHYGNGAVDAELNYQRAKVALLTGKEKPKTTFGKQDKAEGSGPTLPDNSGPSPKQAAPKLDPEAAALAKHWGMKDDEIAEAMQRRILGAG